MRHIPINRARGKHQLKRGGHRNRVDLEGITDPAAASDGETRRTRGVKCLASHSGRALDDELRRLLRSRLIFVHLLALGYVVLSTGLSWAIPTSEQDAVSRPNHGAWLRLVAPVPESLIGSLVLWRSPGMSLRFIRVWEFVCFATLAVWDRYDRFERLAPMRPGSEHVPTAEIGFRGLYSIQGFGALILAFGVLIPNSLRRSLLVVTGLAFVPLAVIPVAVAVDPVLREGHFLFVMDFQLAPQFLVALGDRQFNRACDGGSLADRN
jgi:hypothetical protein